MRDAQGERTRVRISADLKKLETNVAADFADEAILQASGKVITFPGFLRAYVEGSDDPEAELSDKEVILPAMQEGEFASRAACASQRAQHQTTGQIHRSQSGQRA